jgi:hypothetical protein
MRWSIETRYKWNVDGNGNAVQEAGADIGDRDAERAAGQREEKVFGEELPHQRGAGGADGESHGHFTTTRAGAAQQQAGDVGARDGEDAE